MVKEDTLYNYIVELFKLDKKEFEVYFSKQNIKNTKYVYIWKDIYILKFLFYKEIAQNRIKNLFYLYLEDLVPNLYSEDIKILVEEIISNYQSGDYIEKFVFSIYYEKIRVNNQIEELKQLQEYIVFDWRKVLIDKCLFKLRNILSNYHEDIPNDFINFIFDNYLNKNTTIFEFNNKLNQHYISNYIVKEFISKNDRDYYKKGRVISLDQKINSDDDSSETILDNLKEELSSDLDSNFIDIMAFSKILGEIFLNSDSSTNNIRKILYLYLVSILEMKIEKYMISTNIKNQSIVTGVHHEFNIDLLYITLNSVSDYAKTITTDNLELEKLINLMQSYSQTFDNKAPLKYQKETLDKLVIEKGLESLIKKSNYEYIISACKCFLSKKFISEMHLSEDKLIDFQEKFLPLFFSKKQPNICKKMLSEFFKEEEDINSLYKEIVRIGPDLTRKNIFAQYEQIDFSNYIKKYNEVFSNKFFNIREIYFNLLLEKSDSFKNLNDKNKTSFIFSFFAIPIIELDLITDEKIILIKPKDNSDFSFDLSNELNLDIFLLVFERINMDLYIKDFTAKSLTKG